jgi:hypothetical protein
MATVDGNFFELQRRGFQWNKNSTLDDEVSSMLWDSDPNDAVSENTDGETKLVAMPIGSQFMQSNGTLWLKVQMPNIWTHSAVTQTASAMEIYVATTGSDTTGDGSSGSPYATITKAYEQIPYKLTYPVQIKISAGTYSAFPQVINHECDSTGQLIFDGVDGNTNDEEDLTVSTVTAVHGTVSRTVAYDIQVSGSPAWTTNEHAGKFMYIKTGTDAGYYLGIWSNTADTLRVCGSFTGVAPVATDTINIGSPRVTVNSSTSTSMQVKSNKYFGQTDFDDEKRCSVGIGFIKLNYTNMGLRLNRTNIALASSIVQATNDFSVYVEDSTINYNGDPVTYDMFPDNTKVFTQTIGMVPFGGIQCIINTNYLICPRGASIISGCLATYGMYLDNYGFLTSFFCCTRYIYTIMATLYVSYTYLEYPDYSHAAIEIYNSGLQLIHSYCESGAGIILSFCSKLWLKDNKTSASGVLFGLLPDADSNYTLKDNTITASSADVYWIQTTTTDSFPAAGSAITDDQGGWIRHIP